MRKTERDDDEATKAVQSSTGQVREILCGRAAAHAQFRSSRLQRHRENSRGLRLGWKRGTVLGLEFHGGHLVDSWVASDQVRALSSGEAHTES